MRLGMFTLLLLINQNSIVSRSFSPIILWFQKGNTLCCFLSVSAVSKKFEYGSFVSKIWLWDQQSKIWPQFSLQLDYSYHFIGTFISINYSLFSIDVCLDSGCIRRSWWSKGEGENIELDDVCTLVFCWFFDNIGGSRECIQI